MTDDLVDRYAVALNDLTSSARWSRINAVGMTISEDEVVALCNMADELERLRAEVAEAKLSQATDEALEWAANIADDCAADIRTMKRAPNE